MSPPVPPRPTSPSRPTSTTPMPPWLRREATPPRALLRVSVADADPPGELPGSRSIRSIRSTCCWDSLRPCTGGRWACRAAVGSTRSAATAAVRSAGSPRVRITVLIDRSGGAASLLRPATSAPLCPAHPTARWPTHAAGRWASRLVPAPATTAGLWTRCWLDRAVDTLAPSSGARGGAAPPTWRDLTRLHPASSVAATRWSGLDLGPDADALADATRALADAWPWSRLRADPAVADVPGPCPIPGSSRGWTTACGPDGCWRRFPPSTTWLTPHAAC